MSSCTLLLLAVLSIWDYPARQPAHVRLSRQFVAAARAGDAAKMAEASRRGVELLPDDPTWHYNLACSLAYLANREDEAFDELEKAIDCGFRNREAISRDTDLKRLSGLPRYRELLDYADRMKMRPLMFGPLATVDAAGVFGKMVVLGAQNLGWNFDVGCFTARLKLVEGTPAPSTGDLYMNRDRHHSAVSLKRFPGLTEVRFDAEGRARNLDWSVPNVLFPYPTFGNASVAVRDLPFWRSVPRSLLTTQSDQLPKMMKLYTSNQVWVFPAHLDTMPPGTNGDVFASIAPYWLQTVGSSWSDRPYLTAALEASRTLKPEVKADIVRRNLLAPTIQTLLRKSLKGVRTEDDYLGAAAHPTALPSGGLDLARLKKSAQALTAEAVPPLVSVFVTSDPVDYRGPWPELTYGTSFAWAFVLRAKEDRREFLVTAKGAEEYAFVQTHGAGADVKIERVRPDAAKVVIDRRGLSPTNRVDITVVGRNAKTGWGAPSYVSFARMDPSAPYSDPALTPPPEPRSE